MNKKKIEEMFKVATEENFHSFKALYKEVFLGEFNKQCSKINKEVTKDLAKFGVVSEGVSIDLTTPDVKNAELFAIESNDDDNMVVKFKLDGSDDDMEYKVKEEDEEFYKAIEECDWDNMDDEQKGKVKADLSEFVMSIDKDENVERGDELDTKEIKMEADMSKLTGKARLDALKRLGEKKKLEASRKANK